MVISCDFESRSTVDLRRAGVYVYAADPTTDILCLGYAQDDEEVQLWVPGDPVPELIQEAVIDHAEFRAWNANFERILWRELLAIRYGFMAPELEQWHDTMAEAAMLGLPQSLGKAAEVLKAEVQKDSDGHRLMMQMCKPRRPRKDEDPEGIYWFEDAERRARLYDYCKDDVRAERAIAKKIAPLVQGMGEERAVYLLDQEINDRGVPLDIPLIHAAKNIADEGVARACIELYELTDGLVAAPTKVASMKDWLATQGVQVESLDKVALRDLLARDDLDADVRKLLEIRQDTGKSSVKKLESMLAYGSLDGRARGMLNYHAAHTGRWSGRGPQPQNMKRPESDNPELFIPYILLGAYDDLERLAPPIVAVSDIMRSCFKASEGCRFIGGDFTSIELHVLAWLAGQEDSASYYEMASLIFGVPEDSVIKGSLEYHVGKIAVLACGYQLGVKGFIRTVHQWTGLVVTEEVAEKAVEQYRARHAEVKAQWRSYEDAVMTAVASPGVVAESGRTKFMKSGPFLWARLPSGRMMAYPLPRIEEVRLPEPWENIRKPAVTVSTVDSITGRWVRRSLYGGLITENITQATARDVMVGAMLRLNDAGYPIILTVHDEVLSEVEQGFGSVEDFHALLTVTPPWAEGCYINAAAWEGERFGKD